MEGPLAIDLAVVLAAGLVELHADPVALREGHAPDEAHGPSPAPP